MTVISRRISAGPFLGHATTTAHPIVVKTRHGVMGLGLTQQPHWHMLLKT